VARAASATGLDTPASFTELEGDVGALGALAHAAANTQKPTKMYRMGNFLQKRPVENLTYPFGVD